MPRRPIDVLTFCPPGTYRAQHDTALLIEAVDRLGAATGRHVLDLCTGPGTVALAAARAGAASVTAVELSYRSASAARINAVLHRVEVTVRRGDLYGPVAGQRFELLTANPPYVPSASCRLPRHRRARCWDGGLDGRAVLDRVCAGAGRHLVDGGQVLLVHSAVCDANVTLARLADSGVSAQVLDRARIPYGPVMRARSRLLESRGLVDAGADVEEIVLIGGRREC